MPTIATQKSGALAPASDTRLAKRSNRLPGLDAASDPTTSARAVRQEDRDTASFSVCGKASSATSIAERFWRSDSPKSRVEQIAEIVEELDVDGLIEAVQLGEGLPRLRRRVERQEEGRGIAGQPRQEEDEHQQSQDRNDAVEGAFSEITEHARAFRFQEHAGAWSDRPRSGHFTSSGGFRRAGFRCWS